MHYVVFLLEEQQFGVDLSLVERIVSIVEITPLPNASDYFLGAVNIHGTMVPIINLRKLMSIQEREIELSDHLLLCNFQNKPFAFLADSVSRIINCSVNQNEKQVYTKMKGVAQIIEEGGKFIFIIDVNQLLPTETQLLNLP